MHAPRASRRRGSAGALGATPSGRLTGRLAGPSRTCVGLETLQNKVPYLGAGLIRGVRTEPGRSSRRTCAGSAPPRRPGSATTAKACSTSSSMRAPMASHFVLAGGSGQRVGARRRARPTVPVEHSPVSRGTASARRRSAGGSRPPRAGHVLLRGPGRDHRHHADLDVGQATAPTRPGLPKARGASPRAGITSVENGCTSRPSATSQATVVMASPTARKTSGAPPGAGGGEKNGVIRVCGRSHREKN